MTILTNTKVLKLSQYLPSLFPDGSKSIDHTVDSWPSIVPQQHLHEWMHTTRLKFSFLVVLFSSRLLQAFYILTGPGMSTEQSIVGINTYVIIVCTVRVNKAYCHLQVGCVEEIDAGGVRVCIMYCLC